MERINYVRKLGDHELQQLTQSFYRSANVICVDIRKESSYGRIEGLITDVLLENPEDFVLRNAVPIVKNGKTVAMLYGVASLKALSESYTVDIYDGQAFVLGVDGTSGDFLLDTWHNTLRNIEDLNDRTFLMEFTYQEMRKNLENGVSGNLSTVSRKVGKPVLDAL